MLKTSKFLVLSKTIEECGKNSKKKRKKLYNLIIELTEGPKENPFSIYIDDDSLPNKFADFFANKIRKIRVLHKSLELLLDIFSNDLHAPKTSRHTLLQNHSA